MRAVVLRDGELVLVETDPPHLGPGQLLVEPIAVGICGSDLSAREHTADFLEGHALLGVHHSIFDPHRDVVLGHEFTARVIEVGAQVEGFAAGDLLVTLPVVVDGDGVWRTVGYSNDYPGGLADRVVVQAHGHLRIPHDVSPVLSAITEPMATGVNGVLRSNIQIPTGAIVTGCGPVGLGAVVELAQRGIFPVVASDPSPVRRTAATKLGADAAVDPLTTDPVTVWRDLARDSQPLYVFEASGKVGILDALLRTVPPYTRVYVVGTCMTPDTIRPLVAMLNNASVDYVTGPARGESSYHALEAMFRHIARGHFDPRHVVSGYTGFAGVSALFDLLRPQDPHAIEHVKVLVLPHLDTADIVDSDADLPPFGVTRKQN